MWAASALAQTATLDRQEQRERAKREAHTRAQQQDAPDVRLRTPPAPGLHRHVFPVETPCFPVSSIRLDGPHAATFAFAQREANRYANRCVGAQGVAWIVRRVSDTIVAHGYVTTRVGVASQDLHGGTLHLIVQPGFVGRIRFTDRTPLGGWQTALPARPGDVLNLRDIEQALEQFKRLASQEVTIDVAPGTTPDTSDLVITAHRLRPWRIVASLDDSGSRATGRGQAGVNLSLDNPLGLNDSLTVGTSHNVPHAGDHGSSGNHATYVVPYGYWLLTASVSGYRYTQAIPGMQATYRSAGTSRNADLVLQRVVHRGPHGKTALELGVSRRWAHSTLDGMALIGQRRHTTAVTLALVQRQYLGTAQFDGRLAERWGGPWFGGQRDAPGLPRDAPRFRYRLTVLDASLAVPFTVAGEALQWTTDLHAQRSPDVLYGSEWIAIGGRYTVRGFDGEQTLAAERGWTWRNTLTWPVPGLPIALYTGIDTGHVGGPSGRDLGKKSLTGGFVGARGQLGPFDWDAFAGWALRGGRALASMRPATGVSLLYTY